MPYDEPLAARVRKVLARRKDITEKRMFGGLAFMAGPHFCVGVIGDRLMLRLGDPGAAEALAEPHTSLMDFTGRPMKTMIYLDPPGRQTDAGLRKWVNRALAFAASLPPKD